MAKWIYERWQPKWPDTAGTTYRLGMSFDNVGVLSYDGTLQESIRITQVVEGDVFYWRPVMGLQPTGYYRKISNTTVDYLGTDPPFPIKDTLIDTIEAEEGTYPDDGVYSDQLYYVKLKPAFPTMRILRDGQWIEAESGFVLKDGVWKPIEDVFVLKDGQWKNLQ